LRRGLASNCEMRLLAFVLLATLALAGTVGTFGGRVVKIATEQGDRWIYIKGSNGLGRRVEISRARIVYAEEVPASARAADPAADLRPGAVVEVTAELDARGEWRAQSIQIIRVARPDAERSRLAPPAVP
jgi:hypothetical protein